MGSLSQVTNPALDTLTNLYATACPAGIFRVMVHIGLLDVYCEADRAGAELEFQLPSCALLPVILMVSPKAVTTRCVKATDTVVGHPVGVDVGDEVTEEVDAISTTGSPLETVRQIFPPLSAVTVRPLP